jgi:hypothetical protein
MKVKNNTETLLNFSIFQASVQQQQTTIYNENPFSSFNPFILRWNIEKRAEEL